MKGNFKYYVKSCGWKRGQNLEGFGRFFCSIENQKTTKGHFFCDKMACLCIYVIEGFYKIRQIVGKDEQVMLENTVYNKVYKTILHDRPQWVIPMINEIFREQYKGQERIEFLEEIHYIKDIDGKLVERATDSYFKIIAEREQDFHLEAPSTPDVMKMTVEMREFHIFVYENKFMVYNSDEEELEKLKEVFCKMKKHLDMLVESGEMDAYDRFFLISMTIKVVENLAEKFEHVVKGVIEVMSGTKIEYMSREEFYRIREEGLAAGRSEGFNAGRSEGFNAGRSEGLAVGERKAYLAMLKKGILTLSEVAKELNLSEEAVKQYL